MKFSEELWRHYQTKGMPPAVEGVALTGQVVILTGANTGLGFEAAKHFATRGPAKLILVCRTQQRGQDAVNRLKAATGFENVELWTSDLSSFESVKSIRDKIDQLDRLDILVENAGVALNTHEVTKDGWETTLQVNVLSTALRIILHLPKLVETAKKYPDTVPRIVYVTSGAHYMQTVSPEVIDTSNTLKVINDDLEGVKEGVSKRYAESKLLAQSFMRALQTHLPTVTCCSVNPGFCESDLTRHVTGERAETIRKMKEESAYTSEEGSRQLLYAAIGERDKEEQVRGGYLNYSEISECSDFLLGDEGKKLEAKLWKKILEVVASGDERVKEVVEKYLS